MAQRPHGGRLRESSPVPADASSAAAFTSSSLQRNAAAGGKPSSTIPYGRMDKAVMQSCWIQRLNPACETSYFAEEEITEPMHVCTHFTKDFSSCSKRLHKAQQHTHSSSGHPNERTIKFSPSLDMKLIEPIDIEEEHLLSRAPLPMFREENLHVPFEDASESNHFRLKTGSLFSNQNSSHKSVSTLESLVSRSHALRTCDEFYEGESKDEGKLKNFAAHDFQWLSKDSASAVGDLTLFEKPFLNAKFNKDSGSRREVGFAKVLGDAPWKENFAASELPHRMVHIRVSSPDAVIGNSLSPALMGASADADNSMHLSPPLIKDVYPSTPSKPCINRPTFVFGDTEKKINEDQLGVAHKKNSSKVCGKEGKTGRNFGFLHFAGQSKTLNQSPENPCVCSGSCNGGCSDKVGVRNRGSVVSTASISIQRKQNVGFGTFVTNAGPFVTKDFDALQSSNTDLRRYDPIVAEHALNLKEELTTKMLIPSEDFARPSFGETSPGDYWVKHFEDSGPVKLLDTSYSKATPREEHITDEYHRFCFNSTANIWKPDEKEKIKFFPRPSPHIPCDVPPLTHVSLSSSFIQKKQAGLGHNQGDSVDRTPLEGSSMVITLQEESLQGNMRRLAPQTDKNEHNFHGRLSLDAISGVSPLFGHQSHKFCNEGRATEPSRSNQAWIQRWGSSSSLIAMSGKTLSPSLGMDKELGTAPAKRPVITSYKGEKDMDRFDRTSIEPGRRTGKLHVEGSARHRDSGLGVAPRGAFPAYRSHASPRGIDPSVKAMAIVGNTASKLHTTSLQNRGSFSVWPRPSDEIFQERRLSENAKETVEDNMQGVEMDDLEFLQHNMR